MPRTARQPAAAQRAKPGGSAIAIARARKRPCVVRLCCAALHYAIPFGSNLSAANRQMASHALPAAPTTFQIARVSRKPATSGCGGKP